MKKSLGLFWAVALAALWPSDGWARTVVPFTGTVDLQRQEASLVFGWKDRGTLSLLVSRPSPQGYHLSLDVAHLKTPLGDIATFLEGDLDLKGGPSDWRGLSGRLESRYTLVNYLPVRDLRFRFALEEGRVLIHDLSFGAFSGRGDIALDHGRRMNIVIDVLSLELEEAAGFLGLANKSVSPPLTGVATGIINVGGTLGRPDVKGRVNFYNGRLNGLDYESILLDFEGAWPLVRVRDSLITQAEGFSARFDGFLDLSDLASLSAQIALFQRAPIVSTDSDRREWVFKSQRDERDMKTEMKYFLLKDDRGDTGAVLGAQKSLEF